VFNVRKARIADIGPGIVNRSIIYEPFAPFSVVIRCINSRPGLL